MNSAAVPAWLPSFLVPFVSLSYPVDKPLNPDSFPNSSYYGTGALDFCIIISCVAAMAILRDGARLFLFEPFARWKLTKNLKAARRNPKQNGHGSTNGSTNGYANGLANGHASSMSEHDIKLTPADIRKMNRNVVRFAEQGWALSYYAIQFCVGVYVHRNLPTNVLYPARTVWISYPHIPLPAPVKFYYLNESAFYLHGVFILNAEERRKDHWQMMTHHFIALALMYLSYSFNFTRMGCLVMMLMDLCDVILPVAKMCKYMGGELSCDTLFGIFMVSWFMTRHVLFMICLYTTYWDLPREVAYLWNPEIGHYMTKNVYYGFVSLMVVLQIIQLIWFTMVIKVAYKVVTGQGAEDVRTDDSEDEVKKDE